MMRCLGSIRCAAISALTRDWSPASPTMSVASGDTAQSNPVVRLSRTTTWSWHRGGREPCGCRCSRRAGELIRLPRPNAFNRKVLQQLLDCRYLSDVNQFIKAFYAPELQQLAWVRGNRY